jgi:hypothetical protein
MLKMNNITKIIIIFAFLLITISCQADYSYDQSYLENDMNNLNDTIGYDNSDLNYNMDNFDGFSPDPEQNGYIYDNSSDFSNDNNNENNYDISPDDGTTSGIFYSLDDPVSTLSFPSASIGSSLTQGTSNFNP